MQLFFPTAPGAEALLVQELRTRYPHLRPEAAIGGVLCETEPSDVAPLCFGLRTPLGVWWRFARFGARHFGQLEKELAKLDLSKILGSPQEVELKVTSKRSRLYHSKAIAQRFFDTTGYAPATDKEDALKLHLRIFRDKASLSVDLVGGLLPKRGWRKETAKAPLRKDLAAMLLQASGWSPGAPLVDPMCGSGTLLIEAARVSQGLWPNGLRPMDFFRLPGWGAESLKGLDPAGPMPKALQGVWAPAHSELIGMDRNEGALAIAARNEARAGVSGISWTQSEVGPKANWSLPEGAFVVCNPPYGHRVGQKKGLHQIYAQLGRLVKEAGAASRFACIAVRGPWMEALGLELEPVIATDFGGVSVTLYRGAK